MQEKIKFTPLEHFWEGYHEAVTTPFVTVLDARGYRVVAAAIDNDPALSYCIVRVKVLVPSAERTKERAANVIQLVKRFFSFSSDPHLYDSEWKGKTAVDVSFLVYKTPYTPRPTGQNQVGE